MPSFLTFQGFRWILRATTLLAMLTLVLHPVAASAQIGLYAMGSGGHFTPDGQSGSSTGRHRRGLR